MCYTGELAFGCRHSYRIYTPFCDFPNEGFLCPRIQRLSWDRLTERCQQPFCDLFAPEIFPVQQTDDGLVAELCLM